MIELPSSQALNNSNELLRGSRTGILHAMWLGLAAVAIVALPLSLARAVTEGWLFAHFVFIGLAVLIIILAIMRRHLSESLSSAFLVGVLLTVGTTSLIFFGLLGVGLWWLAVACLLSLLLFTARIGFYISILCFLVVALAAWGFVFGGWRSSADDMTFNSSLVSWGLATTGAISLLYLVVSTLLAHAKLSSERAQSMVQQWLDALPLGVAVLDAQSKTFYRNPRARQLLGDVDLGAGKTNKAMLQAGTEQVYPAEHLPGSLTQNRQVCEVSDIELLSSKGSHRLQVWGQPIVDQSNMVQWSILAIDDISIRVSNERRLHELQGDLLYAQSIAKLASWHLTLPSKESAWTEELYHIFGLDPLLPAPSLPEQKALFGSDSWNRLSESTDRAIQQGETYELELQINSIAGRKGWIWMRGGPVLDKAGQVVALRGAVKDITYNKLMLDALRKSEERLKMAISAGGVGIWDWDIVGGDLHWDDSVYRLFGLSPLAKIDRRTVWRTMLTAPELERLEREMEQALAGLKDYNIECKMTLQDGRVKAFRTVATIIRDEQGKPLRMVGCNWDITESKLKQAQLQRALLTAENASRAKSNFLSSVSHELRTPMNAVLGFAQLIKSDSSLSSKSASFLNEIIIGGNHLLTLINDVLDLSSIEADKLDLCMSEVDVLTIVNETLALIRPLADESGIHLDASGVSALAVRADRVRFKQVLINLLSNAVKYNRPQGSVTLTITLTSRGRVLLAVTDTGMGLSAESQQQLFEPFNRLGAGNSEIQGTGIGLAISYRLMKLMGGDLHVHSVVGEGSCFTVDLPAP